MKCFQINVFGKVQGVWYRASTKRKADELGLKGTVQNKSDGSVYIEVEGEEALVQQLIEWCKEGPEFAKVTKVEAIEIPAFDFSSFEIIR